MLEKDDASSFGDKTQIGTNNHVLDQPEFSKNGEFDTQEGDDIWRDIDLIQSCKYCIGHYIFRTNYDKEWR